MDLFGVDNLRRRGPRPRFETVVHLHSLPRNEHVRVRIRLESPDRPSLPTVSGVYPAADWFERRTQFRASWPKMPLFDYAESVGVLRSGVVLVHLTDARPDELARVAQGLPDPVDRYWIVVYALVAEPPASAPSWRVIPFVGVMQAAFQITDTDMELAVVDALTFPASLPRPG